MKKNQMTCKKLDGMDLPEYAVDFIASCDLQAVYDLFSGCENKTDVLAIVDGLMEMERTV